MPTAQDIINAYQRYLGRRPSQSEIDTWIGNGDYENGIRTSPEAQTYRSTHPTAPGNTGQGLRPGDSFVLPNGDTGYVNQDGSVTDVQTGFPAGTVSNYPDYTGPIAPTAPGTPNAPDPSVVTPNGSGGGGSGNNGTPPGGWEKWFMGLVNGLTPGSDSLKGLKDKLDAYGVKILTNAEGISGKIQLPDGTIVDVGRAFSGGHPDAMGWQWLTGDGGGGGSSSNPSAMTPEQMEKILNSPLLKPWTKEFSYPEFQPPTQVTEENDPGYQFRLGQGQQALERAAASKGTLLTGGTLKGEQQFAQDYASNEFQNVYNRSLNDWITNYNKALGEYQQSYNVFSNNQANQFNRLSAMAGGGQTAATQLNSTGIGYAGMYGGTQAGYGGGISGLISSLGNAVAAGQLGQGSAASNFFNQMGGLGAYMSAYGGL